ncbi:MAG: Ada metal-binding domain-containing protein [Sedimentisphaerales bacterium]|nr:Ada metal-binding domain-containing protein [Sedimentisphaerales bacterium]
MRINRKMKFKILIVMCLLAGLTANSSAKLNPRQASLSGANVMTVDVVCSEDVKETDLNQQEIRENIVEQLKKAGIKILPVNLWGTAPGRCRLKVLIKVYKPSDLDTFIYNIKIYFVQTVALERIPEVKIDAVTWELAWLAHGSKSRLAEAVPANLKIMTDNFIRDYHLANPLSDEPSGTNTGNNVSVTAPQEQIRSDVKARYKYVSSKNSKVFHSPQCRSAKRIKPENLVGYNSKEELIQAGKRPCKVCKP